MFTFLAVVALVGGFAAAPFIFRTIIVAVMLVIGLVLGFYLMSLTAPSFSGSLVALLDVFKDGLAAVFAALAHALSH